MQRISSRLITRGKVEVLVVCEKFKLRKQIKEKRNKSLNHTVPRKTEVKIKLYNIKK